LRDTSVAELSQTNIEFQLDHLIFMFGPARFETRSKQVWYRAKVMEVGNGDVWFDDGDRVIVDVD
jgi:hypothetical protein